MIKLTTQQTSFFIKNGYIELTGLFTTEECAKYLAAVKPENGARRDIWREEEVLHKLVTSRQLSNIMYQATGENSLRLACDQWYPSTFSLDKHEKIKDLLSVQEILCAIFIQLEPGKYQLPLKISELGIVPFPQGQGNALLVGPKVLLNWPAPMTDLGLYMVAYATPTAMYIRNPKDCAANSLKKLGYGYGDHLTNETHPILMKRN